MGMKEIFIIVSVLTMLVVISGVSGYAMRAEKQYITSEERLGVLLRTCFPEPEMKYKDTDPICKNLKQLIDESEEDYGDYTKANK